MGPREGEKGDEEEAGREGKSPDDGDEPTRDHRMMEGDQRNIRRVQRERRFSAVAAGEVGVLQCRVA
jgi:hypothetical protein